jgi:glycosyltransferase involved in cell wall biosynthesis
MRLIIPIEFYRKGGVERVIISLICELTQFVDQLIIVLPKKEISYFSSLLPDSEKIIYEPSGWSHSFLHLKALAVLNKGVYFAKKLGLRSLEEVIANFIKKFNSQYRINHLVRKYNANYCLYLLINRLSPPKLKIPLVMLSHDVFWRFAPLTYDESYVQIYDKNLLSWLERSELVFTNSNKTKEDIISIFPKFHYKMKAIPLAGLASNYEPTDADRPNLDCPVFYFPSSFGIYKDHLTLLKATLLLADKGYNFKVVLIGKETDGLLNGNLSLSQQAKTKEYVDYLQECNRLYQEYHEQLAQYVKGLGYCTYEQVESWYNKCACVVVPSRYEGFGLALSEAIVRGAPAIASDLDVFREQADLYHCPDRITFFAAGNPSELARCMEDFLLHPKPKLSSQEIQDRFSIWTWQDVAKGYVDALKSL